MNKPLAVITGAASGIGLKMAQDLAARYRLVLVDINEAALLSVAEALDAHRALVCDLTKTAEVDALVAQVLSLQGELGLLVNNAGITHRSLAADTSQAVLERVMQVNYFAPVQLTQGLYQRLCDDQGTIVNLSSMAGWMPVMGRAGYCAAKAAIHQFFEVLRAESRAKGVKIVMVYPSFVDTPIENHALDARGEKAAHQRSTIGRVRGVDWVVGRIIDAIERGQERVFLDRFTWFASLLYKIAPKTFMVNMERKFAVEIEVHS